MIKELIKFADHLDAKGLNKEADYLDKVIKKAYYGSQHGSAQQVDMSFQEAQAKAKNSSRGIYWEKDDGEVLFFYRDGNTTAVGNHEGIDDSYPYYYQTA